MSVPGFRDVTEMAGAVWPILRDAVTSGRLFRPQCRLTDPDPDILCEWDVRIPLTDGTYVTANVFRSKSATARGDKLPVVMCAHPYDNHLIPALGKTPFGGPSRQYRLIPQEGAPSFSTLTSWEAPDPNFWVRAGYAVVNMNMPGYANSGGRPTLFSPAQTEAFGDAIDWIGSREWCTGKVGLSGVSYLAISQYAVAAGQTSRGVPSCLRAISPWEGISNLFQDLFREGGVPETGFPVFWWHTEVRPTINCSVDEFVASEGHLPQEIGDAHPFYDDYWRAKVPDLEAIELPILICASFSDQGLHSRGSLRAFRAARSSQKWLHTHRRLKWDSYYSDEVLGLTRAFFDCFLKEDTDNGFLDYAPVRLEIRSSRDVAHEVREEHEWPIARTPYRRLMTRGLLAVSRRDLDLARSTEWEPVLKNDHEEKLEPGQIVPIEIALNASSTFFAAGEGIEVVVSPTEIVPSPPFRKDASTNRGVHVIHLGGQYDSHLLIPVVPSSH